MQKQFTGDPCEPLNERYSRYEEAQLLLAELRDLYVQWNECHARGEQQVNGDAPVVAIKSHEAPLMGAGLRDALADLSTHLVTDVGSLTSALVQRRDMPADAAKLGALHTLLSEMLLSLCQHSAPRVPAFAPRPFLSSEALLALATDAPHLGLTRGDVLHVPLSCSEASQLDLLRSPELATALLPGRRATDLRRASAERRTPPPLARFDRRTALCKRFFKAPTHLPRVCANSTHLSRANTLRELERERTRRFCGTSEAHEPRSPVSFVALSADGTHALVTACQEPGEATLYALRGGAHGLPLEGHRSTVSDCAFSSDDSLAFTAGHDGTVRVWDAHNALPLHTLAVDAAPMLLVAPHSTHAKLLATAGQNRSLHLWNTHEGTCTQALHDIGGVKWSGAAAQLSFLRQPGRSDVLMAGLDTTWRDVMAPLIFYQLAPAGASLLRVYEEHPACIGACTAAPHTDGLILSGSSRVLLLNDLRQAAATRHLSITQTDVHCVAFSSCERFLCSGGDDNTALVYDTRFGNTPLHVLAHDAAPHTGSRDPNQNQGVMAVAWFGAHLLSAGEDGTLRTWEVTSGNPLIHKAAVHSAPMSAMAVSAQHDLILTGADDCKAVLHTLPGDTRRLPAVL